MFYHQCLFSPPASTWITAINNNHFNGLLGLTATAVCKYLLISTATIKGPAKQPPQNELSTTKPTTYGKLATVCSNSEGDKPDTTNTIFCWTVIADTKNKTVYIELADKFPYRSFEANKYTFVTYDCNSNAIIRGFNHHQYRMLNKKRQKPKFCVLDNEASSTIKKFLIDESIDYQIVLPKEHGVNSAKRAIQTFKNHFISGLRLTDPNFPLQLWDQFLPQAEDSLNMLLSF
ncbi:hypothetical protein ACHAXS_000946 [Conticribra weissflogii]